MTCPNCGTANDPGRKFCGECGNRLAVVCGNCSTPNPPGTRFCGECGNGLGGAAPAPSVTAPSPEPSRLAGVTPSGAPAGNGNGAAAGPVAERRLVTVLFADLVGFTTLSEG